MCLATIIRKTSYKKKLCYKVFVVNNGNIFSVYRGNGKPLEVNKLLLASRYYPTKGCTKLSTDKGNDTYNNGWHACSTMEDAINWARIHYKYGKIFEVILSGKTTIGTSAEAKAKSATIVSTYMKILKEMPYDTIEN